MVCVSNRTILLRWVLEADTRPCPLSELLVIAAQTGNEYADTEKTSKDTFCPCLPLMRAHRIRFVQVARGGQHESD
jgi:hypothetical protein